MTGGLLKLRKHELELMRWIKGRKCPSCEHGILMVEKFKVGKRLNHLRVQELFHVGHFVFANLQEGEKSPKNA
jgi:DNA-directed RNA polymerase subunit RPC12/RpoP